MSPERYKEEVLSGQSFYLIVKRKKNKDNFKEKVDMLHKNVHLVLWTAILQIIFFSVRFRVIPIPWPTLNIFVSVLYSLRKTYWLLFVRIFPWYFASFWDFEIIIFYLFYKFHKILKPICNLRNLWSFNIKTQTSFMSW